MSLSRTVSETNCNFSRKLPIFPTPVYLTPPLKGFPKNWTPALQSKKNYTDGAIRPNKKFDDIFSRVDTIHQRDGRPGGQTDRHRATAKTALTHSVARVKIKAETMRNYGRQRDKRTADAKRTEVAHLSRRAGLAA